MEIGGHGSVYTMPCWVYERRHREQDQYKSAQQQWLLHTMTLTNIRVRSNHLCDCEAHILFMRTICGVVAVLQGVRVPEIAAHKRQRLIVATPTVCGPGVCHGGRVCCWKPGCAAQVEQVTRE